MKKCLILLFVLLCTQVYSQQLQTSAGVHVISYQLEQGNAYVYLPVNVVAGEAYSGSIALYPSGSSKHEIAKQQEKMALNSIQIQEQMIPLKNGAFSVKNASSSETLRLQSDKGKLLGQNQLQFTLRRTLLTGTPISMPTHIANGVNSAFYGPFDGDVGNTRFTANGQPIKVIAESPVQIAIRPETLSTTDATIEIVDGGNTYQGRCHSIYYTLKVG
ncbi:MAG: hypothetical protein AAF466_01140, partial [Bacteroidota bacterium]